jgi:hypothetical protein
MPIERETIVTGGTSPGTIILGIIGAVAVVLLIVWLMGGLNIASAPNGGTTVDLDVPPVTLTPPVTVNPPA